MIRWSTGWPLLATAADHCCCCCCRSPLLPLPPFAAWLSVSVCKCVCVHVASSIHRLCSIAVWVPLELKLKFRLAHSCRSPAALLRQGARAPQVTHAHLLRAVRPTSSLPGRLARPPALWPLRKFPVHLTSDRKQQQSVSKPASRRAPSCGGPATAQLGRRSARWWP